MATNPGISRVEHEASKAGPTTPPPVSISMRLPGRSQNQIGTAAASQKQLGQRGLQKEDDERTPPLHEPGTNDAQTQPAQEHREEHEAPNGSRANAVASRSTYASLIMATYCAAPACVLHAGIPAAGCLNDPYHIRPIVTTLVLLGLFLMASYLKLWHAYSYCLGHAFAAMRKDFAEGMAHGGSPLPATDVAERSYQEALDHAADLIAAPLEELVALAREHVKSEQGQSKVEECGGKIANHVATLVDTAKGSTDRSSASASTNASPSSAGHHGFLRKTSPRYPNCPFDRELEIRISSSNAH